MRVIDRLENVNDYIDGFVKWIIIVTMVIIPTVMMTQVVIRYVFNYPLGWPEEAARFAFVWLTFMSACAALRRGELATMAFFIQRMPRHIAYVLTVIGRLCILIFLAVAIYSGYDMTSFVFGRGTKSPVLPVPMWFVYMSLPVGCLFMAYQVVISLFHQIGGTTPRRATGPSLAQQD
jgi:TRAP-type C4-dicarboxylate transport system permease small subunit